MEWYENDGAIKLVPVTGVAILRKGRGNATVSRVLNVAIGIKQLRKGYELKPGIESSSRRVTVNGGDIKDIPCQYCIVGLDKYELPAIGNYYFITCFNYQFFAVVRHDTQIFCHFRDIRGSSHHSWFLLPRQAGR